MLSKYAKLSGHKTFELLDGYSIDCNYYETRYSWGHYAILFKNKEYIDESKFTYYNRTWESYTYESIIHSLLNKHKLTHLIAVADSAGNKSNQSIFSSVAMVAKLGDIFGSNQKESNDWKTRILQAGLPELDMPEDWNTLPEDQKEIRLNKVIKELKA
jgi:hypothetical protein